MKGTPITIMGAVWGLFVEICSPLLIHGFMTFPFLNVVANFYITFHCSKPLRMSWQTYSFQHDETWWVTVFLRAELFNVCQLALQFSMENIRDGEEGHPVECTLNFF